MRARNIKPGFFKNAELADAGLAARLLFIGLWCMADREGRLKDKPRVIKAEIFPFDHDNEVDVIHSLSTLEKLGLIHRYEVHGLGVIEIANFKKHQSPHHTEKASDLPAPVINGGVTVSSPLSNGGNPSDSLIPDSLNHDSLIPEKAANAADEEPEEEVFVDRRQEAFGLWDRVIAAIQYQDLQKSFPPGSPVAQAINLIGGWKKLGLRGRDQRGQTQQEFMNAYASLFNQRGAA